MATVTTPPREQSRARYPDAEGYVERNGVRTFWESYGHGEPTILFVPPWAIVHSRVWKMQLPYFGRHFRALAFDPRGNGRSDRPQDAAAYAETEYAADALAVLDATGTDRAVVVTLSLGSQRSLILAAEHPERVAGLVFIGPSLPLLPRDPGRMVHSFDEPLDTDEGWAKFNQHYWRADFRGFLEFFFSQIFSEPHSTKHIEDAVGWGLETDAETLIATHFGPDLGTREGVLEVCERVRCPVLVIHGDGDRITPHARGVELARATGGRLVTIGRGGHCPQARDPVQVNLLIRDFVERLSWR